jgi:hypothetical protein
MMISVASAIQLTQLIRTPVGILHHMTKPLHARSSNGATTACVSALVTMGMILEIMPRSAHRRIHFCSNDVV